MVTSHASDYNQLFHYSNKLCFFKCTFVLSAVGFEIWHLELIAGLVIMVSSCRFLLLKTWPDFAESSEAANQQVGVLTSGVDLLS